MPRCINCGTILLPGDGEMIHYDTQICLDAEIESLDVQFSESELTEWAESLGA